ncbi:hypothetical protein KCP76_06675 [Salmonella enterica subsp. enterica serovar Weltevreden]|nr:hypothetical protein KCP76_06675 [Salmonella enterica subsp. enterica serovar Weltevreden]
MAENAPRRKLSTPLTSSVGAKIAGQGHRSYYDEGVERLGGGVYRVPPDRIETGTFPGGGSDPCGKILPPARATGHLGRGNWAKLRDAGADIEARLISPTCTANGRRRSMSVLRRTLWRIPDRICRARCSSRAAEPRGSGRASITETVFENCLCTCSNSAA